MSGRRRRGRGALVAAALAIPALACGHEGVSSTETTSATAVTASPVEDAIRLQRERDDARQAAVQCQDEVPRLQAAVRVAEERDDLAQKAWSTVHDADVELKLLELDASRAPTPRARAKLEMGIADLKAKRDIVERDARAVPEQRGSAWPRFKHLLETSIEDLARVLGSTE